MKIERGFTLMELLVTLAIAGVLLTMAVPSFKTTITNNRQVAQINELLGAIMYARSEAITENKSTILCASSDETSCNTNWSQGWIVYVPSGSTITPLRVHSALDGGNTLKSDTAIGTTITFKSNGTSSTTGTGTFTLCDSRGSSYARALSLSSTGIARASQTVGKEIDGTTALSCP
ncbi:MAG: GspH/FimT family pseudopilin [Gammaproteobacteria bacterium]